jgi:hypothetical protein
MTVSGAAKRYECSPRTIRRWCQDAGLGCRVGGNVYRISIPLCDLYAAGYRRTVRDFTSGKPPSELVTDTFAHHGVLKALADYQARKLKAEASKPVRATRSGGMKKDGQR